MVPAYSSGQHTEGKPKKKNVFQTDKYDHALKILDSLHKAGFLEAQIIVQDSLASHPVYSLQNGKKYYYKIDSVFHDPMAPVHDQLIPSQDEIVDFKGFENVNQKILDFYNNNGYPFARIKKDKISINDSLILLEIEVDAMEKVLFAGINVEGDLIINTKFLENYTGIKPDDPFNDHALNNGIERLESLEFVSMKEPAALHFMPGFAYVNIPLSSARANRFDAIAGISGGGGEDLSVTGIVNLALFNALARGEAFQLFWNATGNGTQILRTETNFPYPLGLPVSIGGNFDIHKQDTSWIKVRARPEINFQNANHLSFRTFFDYINNSVTGNAQSTNSENQVLNSFTSRLYGLGLGYSSPGFNRFLLEPGMEFDINIAAGNTIHNYPNSEDGNEKGTKKIIQLNNEIMAAKRWAIAKRITFTFSTNFMYQNGDNLPDNQLFQFGGFRDLKGFDELSIRASSFWLHNIEIRYFTDQESFFSAFINSAWYENKTSEGYFSDLPVGFGAGINQNTTAGIFAIYLALGISNDIPFSFRNSKIHVGYISKF